MIFQDNILTRFHRDNPLTFNLREQVISHSKGRTREPWRINPHPAGAARSYYSDSFHNIEAGG
jgi:hypothetical protein